MFLAAPILLLFGDGSFRPFLSHFAGGAGHSPRQVRLPCVFFFINFPKDLPPALFRKGRTMQKGGRPLPPPRMGPPPPPPNPGDAAQVGKQTRPRHP